MLIALLAKAKGQATGPETPPEALIGHWELDDAADSETAADSSANANAGAVTGVTFGEDAIVVAGGTSAKFGGTVSPGIVTIPDIAAYHVAEWSFAPAVQINVAPGIGEKHIIGQKDGGSSATPGGWEFAVRTDAGGIPRWSGFVKDAAGAAVRIGGSVDGVGVVDVREAYRPVLSVEQDGTMQLRLLVAGDATLLDSRAGVTGMQANPRSLGLGIYLPTSAGPLDGWMGDVRLYGLSLTDVEIEALPDPQDVPVDDEPTPPPGVALRARWRMDETSGTVVTDAIGNSNAVATNCTRNTDSLVAGDTGKSIELNGTTSKIAAPHVAQFALATFTVVVYFQLGTFPGSGSQVVLWAKDAPSESGGTSIEVRNTGGVSKVRAYHKDGAGATVFVGSSDGVGPTLVINTGYMVVLTVGPAGAVLYVDKASVATAPTATTGLVANNEEVGIGVYRPTAIGTPVIAGFVDEVRIYEGVLPPADITLLPDAQDVGVPAPPPPPPGEIPTNPLNTHTPVLEFSGTRNPPTQVRPGGRSDGPVYDLGLRNRSPAPARFNFDNAGWNYTNAYDAGPRQAYPFLIDATPGCGVVGGLFHCKNPYRRANDPAGGPSIGVDVYVNSAAVNLNAGCTDAWVFGTRAHRIWDGFRLAKGTSSTVGQRVGKVSHCWASEVCDDVVEFDTFGEGEIEDCLFDKIFVGISLDPGSGYSGPSHQSEVVVVDGCLMYIDGALADTHPGRGVFIKSHSASQSCHLRNNVWRFERIDGNMSRMSRYMGTTATKLLSSTNNTLIWTGSGGFPTSFPASVSWLEANGWTVLLGTAGVNFWNTAKANWIAAHPYVPRMPAIPQINFPGDPT